MGELIPFPIGPVPEPIGDPYLDAIELEIIREAAQDKLWGSRERLRGLASARSLYLRTRAIDLPDDPNLYVGSVLRAVRRLPDCVRGKLNHPVYTRHLVQVLLREEQP